MATAVEVASARPEAGPVARVALAVPELELLCSRLSILSPASLEVQEVDGSPESLEHTLVASCRRRPRVIGIHDRRVLLKLAWPQTNRALAAASPRSDVSRHGFFIGGPVRDLKNDPRRVPSVGAANGLLTTGG